MNCNDKKQSFEPLYSFTRRKTRVLMDAIDQQDCEKIRRLFSKKTFDESLVAEEERKDVVDGVATPQYAYQQGKIDALMAMLDCGVDPGEHLYYMEGSLVEDLIREEDTELLTKVLPYVEDIDGIRMFDDEDKQIKTTYLGLCAYLGKVEAAKVLMESGALLKPRPTAEALTLNEDREGTYSGAFNLKYREGRSITYHRPWKNQNLEPWQFSVLCGDQEKASWFLERGSMTVTNGLKDLALQIREREMMELIRNRFPDLFSGIIHENNARNILNAANAKLLNYVDLGEADVTELAKFCTEEEEIVACYHVLKARLPRELTREEKRRLVKLMLFYRSKALIEICEKEWNAEEEPCDITEWAPLIPRTGTKDHSFVKALRASKLRLVIHPEDEIFDERYHYFDQDTGMYQMVCCYINLRNLMILDQLVEVISPERDENLLPFTERVLNIGKKGAFERLIKWGLIHEKNMAKVSEYIVEKELEQYYDLAIAEGEGKGNLKCYDL